MKATIELEIPDDIVDHIIKETQEKMAEEVIAILQHEQRRLRSDIAEAEFVRLGIRVAEMEVRKYVKGKRDK